MCSHGSLSAVALPVSMPTWQFVVSSVSWLAAFLGLWAWLEEPHRARRDGLNLESVREQVVRHPDLKMCGFFGKAAKRSLGELKEFFDRHPRFNSERIEVLSFRGPQCACSLDHQLAPCMSAMHERHTSFVTDNTDSTLSSHNKAI